MAINYGEMQVKLTPRGTITGTATTKGVMRGSIGVSGPPSDDYEALIKKPQINGVTLIGNKSNADLGIPTELADLTDDETHRTVTDEDIETWNGKSDFSGSYNDLTDVPDDLVEDGDYVHTDNNYTDTEKSKLEGIESGAEANVQSDWNEADNTKDDFIKNKPSIPTALKDLSDDSTHRLVTDSNISAWNAKSDFSGSYNDLTDKPTIPDELKDLQDDTTLRLVTDTEKTTWSNKSDFSGSYNDLTNKPTIPDAQIQSDWEQSDNSKKDYIKNKPTIPAAQIQSDWNEADNTKADYIKNKPQNLVSDADYVHTDNNFSDTEKSKLGGIAAGAEVNVQSDWNEADSSDDAYIKNKPTIPAAQVNSDWNANSGVAEILNKPDLTDYIQKSETAGLVKNDGTIDTNSYALTSQIPDVSILGNTDISGVADGTVTGAIDAFANTILGSFDYNAAQGKLYYEAALGSPYTFSIQNGVLIVNKS